MTPAFVPLIEDGKEVVRKPHIDDHYLADGQVFLCTHYTGYGSDGPCYPIYARVDSLELAKPDLDTQCKIAFAEMCIANNTPPIRGECQNKYGVLAMRFLVTGERSPELLAEMERLTAAMTKP